MRRTCDHDTLKAWQQPSPLTMAWESPLVSMPGCSTYLVRYKALPYVAWCDVHRNGQESYKTLFDI